MVYEEVGWAAKRQHMMFPSWAELTVGWVGGMVGWAVEAELTTCESRPAELVDYCVVVVQMAAIDRRPCCHRSVTQGGLL